jgi:predicted SPOUT superfamily RNA methylase MTH1
MGTSKARKKRKREATRAREEQWTKSKRCTLSLAVAPPLASAKGARSYNLDAATLAAGLVARAAAVFRVDELVVYDDGYCSPEAVPFVASILRYLETPQYLRKHLVPTSSNLKRVGLLPPLDAPHHPRQHEWAPFREGCGVTEQCSAHVQSSNQHLYTHLADVGLQSLCQLDQPISVGERVTVAMGDAAQGVRFNGCRIECNDDTMQKKEKHRATSTSNPNAGSEGEDTRSYYFGKAVDCSTPRKEHGMYWSFNVREAKGLNDAINQCPFAQKYSCVVGTSERAESLHTSVGETIRSNRGEHMLLVLGGQEGLEAAAETDRKIKAGSSVSDLFDYYINCIPDQGSRTVRTEEAAFACLAVLQPYVIADR